MTKRSLIQIDEELEVWYDNFLDRLESFFMELFGGEAPKPGSAGERLLDEYYFRIIPRILSKHISCDLPSDDILALGASHEYIVSIDKAGFCHDFAFATLETLLDAFKVHEDSPFVVTEDRSNLEV